MANFCFQEPLGEDMSKFKTAETCSNDKPLFAIGTMPSITGRQETQPVPFLASATGESGERLRLTVADKADWQWGDSKDASLRLSVIDPRQSEREISWASDGLPITQIKYVEGLSNQLYVRWLLVQKQSSTTILQPNHHPVPMPVNEATDDSLRADSTALVQANPILKLRPAETGGNAHSDVVFSPAAFGQDPLLAVIDECGFWSIWNIMGTRRQGLDTIRLGPRVCGHIKDGLLPAFPTQHKYMAEKHGLLCMSLPDRQEGDPLEAPTRSESRAPPVLLLWKSDQIQAINMHSGGKLSPLKKFWAPDGKSNRILDVQHCPAAKDRVFILTEQSLVWAEIRRGHKHPLILHSVPHIGLVSAGMKLTTCALVGGTAMAFIYSVKTSQMAVYWLTVNEIGGAVHWHRHVTSLPGAGDFPAPSSIYQISVTPLDLQISGDGYPSGLGSGYKRAGVDFFQVNMISDTLGIRYGIYTTTYSPGQEIMLPTKRLGWSMTEQQRQWKKRRKHFLQHFENTFVLPDGMTEKELTSVLQRRDAGEDELGGQKEPEPKITQPVRLNMERLCRSIGRNLAEAQRSGPRGLPRDLLEAIKEMFEASEPGHRAPLATWHQLAEAVGDEAELDDVENDMQTEIENLFDSVDENKVIAQVRRFHEKEPADSLIGFAYLYNEYCNFWLDAENSRLSEEVQDIRRSWVAEVARNMLFSSYGVLIQDVPVFGPQNLEVSQGHSSRAPASSALLTSSPRSSQFSQEPESTGGTDGAISRLRLLAPSLASMDVTSKPHSLLSYWPAERGHDTDSYVSTVAVAADDKFRDVRERLQRKEAKRRSHVDKFRRQSMMRQSIGRGQDEEPRGSSPGPTRVQVMSSQTGPSSSQTQAPSMPPLTMSQPVSGAFGARKKKKPKRKSGFR